MHILLELNLAMCALSSSNRETFRYDSCQTLSMPDKYDILYCTKFLFVLARFKEFICDYFQNLQVTLL